MAYDLCTLGEAYTKKNEGLSLTAYQDTRGLWTIGYGYCSPTVHSGLVWTQSQADSNFDSRWKIAAQDAENCVIADAWAAMGVARQAVLADCAYQLGFRGLRSFYTMRGFLNAERWADAAADALTSLAAHQTPNRWNRHAEILRQGDAAIVDGTL